MATEQAPGELGLHGLDMGTQGSGFWHLPEKRLRFAGWETGQREVGHMGTKVTPLRAGLRVPIYHAQEWAPQNENSFLPEGTSWKRGPYRWQWKQEGARRENASPPLKQVQPEVPCTASEGSRKMHSKKVIFKPQSIEPSYNVRWELANPLTSSPSLPHKNPSCGGGRRHSFWAERGREMPGNKKENKRLRFNTPHAVPCTDSPHPYIM